MKKCFITFLTLALILVQMTACQNASEDGGFIEVTQQEQEETSGEFESQMSSLNSENDENSFYDEAQDNQESEDDNTKFDSDRNFSNGYLWVKYDRNENWSCIDVNGNIIFELDPTYYPSDDFIGEFCIVDRIKGKKPFVINTAGETVFSLEDSGYDEIYSDDAFDLGYIIVSRKEDTFNRSGTFYYVVNLKNSEIEEVNIDYEPESSLKPKSLGRYLDCGFYALYNSRRESECDGGLIILYDISKNKIVKTSFSGERYWDDKREWDSFYPGGWIVLSDNGFATMLGGYDYDSIVKVDYDTLVMTIEMYDKHNSFFQSGKYKFIDRVICNSDEEYLYDIESDATLSFVPQIDYKFEMVSAMNGRFLITAENDVNTEYFTIMDFSGNIFFDPIRYYENTFLCEEYLIYQTDERSFSIMRLSDKEIVKVFDDVTFTHFDEDNRCIWFENSNGSASCYSVDGELIIGNVESEIPSGNFYNDFVLIKDKQTKGFYYLNKNGEILELKK